MSATGFHLATLPEDLEVKGIKDRDLDKDYVDYPNPLTVNIFACIYSFIFTYRYICMYLCIYIYLYNWLLRVVFWFPGLPPTIVFRKRIVSAEPH